MMMKTLLLALLACAACGGGGTPQPTTPPASDPLPVTATPALVAGPPVEPVQETEPAPPAAPDPAQRAAELLAAETAAFERARPVFDRWCAKCHARDGRATSAKKRAHFDMTTYPFGGHHAMEISDEIRASLGLTGKKPTMPFDKKGAVKGEDLALIKAWADAFDAAHEGGAHQGHGAHGGGHKH